MLTFNISVGKHNLPTDMPYQIIPNTRTYLDRKHLTPYSGGNKDCIIHVGYPIIPFLPSSILPQSKVSEQLIIYKELAQKINAGYILIHLPKSQQEYMNFKAGFQMILNRILMTWKGTVLLETEPFTKNMYQYMKGKNFREMFAFYFKPILELLPYGKKRVKIILDTAHLFACGCKSLDDFKFIEDICGEYLSDVIHLNGNVANIGESDEHIPFIVTTDENKIAKIFGEDEYNKLLQHVFSKYRIVISENNFTKYPNITYETYAEWASKNNVKIVPSPVQGNYILS